MKKNIFAVAMILMCVGCFILGTLAPNKEKYLKMDSVVSWDATESGLLLHTEDGNGYYWEE